MFPLLALVCSPFPRFIIRGRQSEDGGQEYIPQIQAGPTAPCLLDCQLLQSHHRDYRFQSFGSRQHYGTDFAGNSEVAGPTNCGVRQDRPQTILRLFHSIIEARKETHDFFLKIVASNPDPEIQKNNDSHKHWIDGLTNAFNDLGGDSWLSKQKNHPDEPNGDEAETVFVNAFSTLNMDDSEEKQDEDEDEEEEAEQATTPAAVRSSKKKPVKKGKKGRRGRKPKGKSKTAVPAPTGLDQVPLESYRIIEDDTGIITDYLMATYSLYLNNGLSCAITSKEPGATWPTKA